MNPTRRPMMIRATAAAFAAVATIGLFNSVFSLSEPQRSTLIAATQSRPSQAAGALPVAGVGAIALARGAR